MKNNKSLSHVESIKKMMKEITQNKITIQDNLEVIYKLTILHEILGYSIQNFLSQVDDSTKDKFFSTVNHFYNEKYNDSAYKDFWWKTINHPEFPPNLSEKLRNINGNDLHLIFTDIEKKH